MAGSQKITVLHPMGYPPTVTGKSLAPRLETLDGKTVYPVDCRFDDADIFLKQMQACTPTPRSGEPTACCRRICRAARSLASPTCARRAITMPAPMSLLLRTRSATPG